jgi:hypothetical protein
LSELAIIQKVERRSLTSSENVLVILGKDTAGDDIAVVGRFARVDVDDRDDSGGADLKCDATSGIELISKDVFVIG